MYKGELKGFPVEVVEKMLDRQFEQTGKRDVKVFENESAETFTDDGFDWDLTEEGDDFWFEVIYHKNFDVFFQKYPIKKQNKKQKVGRPKNTKEQKTKPLSIRVLDAYYPQIREKLSELSIEERTELLNNL